MNKVQILYIIRKAEGGMKRHLLSLINFLDKGKYHLGVVCSFDKETLQYLKNKGIEVFELEIGDGFSLVEDMKTIRRLRSIIKEFKAEIVHMHGFKAAFVGRIAALGLPVKTVVTFHNFPQYGEGKGFKNRVILFLLRYLNKRTDAFIAVSEALKKEVVRAEKINGDKVHVIYNCLEQSFYKEKPFDLRGSFKLPSDAFVVGTVARLIPSKGVQDLIDLAFLMKEENVFFFVAGEGPYRGELERKIREKGLEKKVFLLGFINDIQSFLKSLDVFILPSHKEGFGISVLEAMKEGVPVIAYSVGGVPEIVKDRVNGFLVEKEDIKGLYEALERLLKDADLRRTFSLKGKETAEKFNCEEMVKKTKEIYERIRE
ncbi:glycosyltransferase family 4 protein [Caldanaerobacter sp.]|uniref:glycosyltransferase family 4 protein n=1 Tax=Caldanaerobacter sp. TaxID=2930036 RepID=UPI003C76EDDA